MQLLNGTEIKYRELVIPCCSVCNGQHLSVLEGRIATASQSAGAWYALPDADLFLWASKILYGNLYREAFLLMDRTTPELGTITDEEFLTQLRTVHLFLQGVRWPIRFQGHAPGSIFRCELLLDDDPDLPEEEYWFYDNPFALVLAIRTGPVGTIVALQDNGVIAEAFQPVQDELNERRLTHLQFIELAAQFACIRLALNRTTKYVMIDGDDGIDVMPLPLGGMSRRPLFDQASLLSYATLLGHMIGWTPAEVMPAADSVLSFFEPESRIFPLAALLDPASGFFWPREDSSEIGADPRGD